jgi:hypothetical protein
MNSRDDQNDSEEKLHYSLQHYDDELRQWKESLASAWPSDSEPVSSVSSSNSYSIDVQQPPPPSVYECLKRTKELSGAVVNHPLIQAAALICIILNAVVMSIATFPFVYSNPNLSKAFEKSDLVFLTIFSVESGMQLIYHGIYLFLDGWLAFDLLLVLFSWAFSPFTVLRSFRIVRVLRLLNRVQNIRDLVDALLSAMPRLIAMAGLLGLIFYIFAVMFTHLFKDLPLEEPYFVSLSASLFTLFQVMSLDWASIARECMAYYSWAWIPFVTFIITSSFVAFNLIIAVICDAVGAIASSSDGDNEEHVASSTTKETREVHKEFNFFDMERKLHALSIQVQEITQTQSQIEYLTQLLLKQVHAEGQTTSSHN